jgi:hypothetical protein
VTHVQLLKMDLEDGEVDYLRGPTESRLFNPCEVRQLRSSGVASAFRSGEKDKRGEGAIACP